MWINLLLSITEVISCCDSSVQRALNASSLLLCHHVLCELTQAAGGSRSRAHKLHAADIEVSVGSRKLDRKTFGVVWFDSTARDGTAIIT